MAISDSVRRKFIESYSGGGIEVLSDTGWKPIEKIHKTEVYDIWEVVTTSHSLKCADNHILFTDSENGLDEVFAKDLHIGDQIYTDTGWESVVDVYNTDESDNMYDIELDDENHRYYTNGILSHNSTTTRAFLLWQALFTRDITIAILANKLSLAMEQLQQLKESYAMLPYWMQPGLRQWNKKTVQLSHNTRVMCAATSPDGIRGLAVNILYIDEFAFIPHYIADEFIASIFPTISSGKSTKIFITSTPHGMNHFYTMWDNAIKDHNHKGWNHFIAKEIPWNAVPDRDEEWAKTQIRQIGQIRFNQEFLCIGYNETITIHNTNDDSVSVVKIGDLHTQFAFGGRIAYVDALEILTPTGYKPFVGIVSRDQQPGIQLTLSDNSIFTCANKHRILTESGFNPAIETMDKTILGRDAYVSSISDIGSTTFYDIIEVDDHEFISSGLISHNCDFVGSVSTLIDNNFLKTLRPVDPLELPNLPEFIKIWEVPKSRDLMETKAWEYIACLDAGYGVRADSSVLKIYIAKSNINLHLVAQMSANDMEIDEFCDCAYQLLNKYNQPNLIIEMNGPGTAAMEFFHMKAEYENLIHFDPRGKMKGLWAGDKLKNAAVIMLKSYVQRKLVKDNDSDTIAELFSFGKVTKEKWGAMGGNHDDHVMCMLWCIYYVNSPLFYGNMVDANIAGMKNPDLVLETDDTLIEEETVFSTMKNPEFHKKELEDAAKYNPYDRESDETDNSHLHIRIIGEDEYDDNDNYVGGFRA